MTIPKTLHSKRLTLRPWSFKDVERCHEFSNDPDYSKFLSYAIPQSIEEIETFIASQISADPASTRVYVIELEGEAIGSIRISFRTELRVAEIGYGIWKPWWGHGFTTEAVNLLLDASFQNIPQLARAAAFAEPENTASLRVMEKAGFSHEGTMRKAYLREDTLRDRMNLAILRDEWHELDRPRYWNLSDKTELTTPRLILRQRTRDFAHFAFDASRYEGFNDGMLWDPPETVEELYPNHDSAMASWKAGTAYPFAIHSKEGKIIGAMGIRPDAREPENQKRKNLGFWMHPQNQNKGYMTEAVNAMLSFGFHQYGADLITADFLDWNTSSKRVLEKSGFKWKETYPDDFEKNGQMMNSEHYQITKEEYQKL